MADFVTNKKISTSVCDVFSACSSAILNGVPIRRANRQDKEFHFQNWFKTILENATLDFDEPGRNTYPDFRLVHTPIGYEIKGLGVPGRIANYDCNSQIPHGIYRGRHIIYVFGRYPSRPDRNEYPVFDLVLCHGSFLNADNDYVHENKSIRGLGSYGDILLRDRKMYVAPTPYGLLEGVERQVTLILPVSWPSPPEMIDVGQIVRTEADQVMTGYQFDLLTHEIKATWAKNPKGGIQHGFVAYRAVSTVGPSVSLREAD
jgi:hypothetical protein